MWDDFVKEQMWHLGLVVLKDRKAAKAWSLRYKLLTKLSAVEQFLSTQTAF